MSALLQTVIAAFYRLLEIIMVVCMSTMLVMVFGNVVLRIFFNTGIDLSEEIPRFAFVWMTFLGAVVGLHKRAHLGVDLVVQALPVLGRRICWALSQVIMLVCSIYILYGTYLQHDIIAGNSSPVAQISTLWVYGVSYVTGAALIVICGTNLVRLALGHVADNELIEVHEEGVAEAAAVEHELAEQAARTGAKS
ncbi:MAG TPA: TRAP transporter small permease [Xanthobacteraceae bacterium]|nr:TRAP transporter small permease [Xanthobacteraceae bacterium]